MAGGLRSQTILVLVSALLTLVVPWPLSPDAAVSVVIVCLSLALIYAAAGVVGPGVPTHLGFFYLLFVVTVFLPGLVVAEMHQQPARNAYLLAIHLTLITVPAGGVLANLVSGFRRQEFRVWVAAPVTGPGPSIHLRVLFGLALGVATLLAAGYVMVAPSLPLLEFIRHRGSAAELVLLREESFKLLDSPLRYAFDVARRVAWPVLVCLGLGWWLQTRRGTWLAVFVVTAGIGLSYAALSLAKMPPAAIILVAVIFLLLYQGGRVSLSGAVVGLALVFAFPVVVVAGLNQDEALRLGRIFQLLLHRMFYLPAEILYYYFEVFPDKMAHLHGLSVGRVAWLLGEPGVDVSNIVFQYIYPDGLITGAAPAAFIGALHADFGLGGVVIGGLALGAVIQGIQVYLVRRRKSVPTLAAAAFIYWGVWQLNLTAMPQTFLSGGILPALAAMLALEWGERALALGVGRGTALSSV